MYVHVSPSMPSKGSISTNRTTYISYIFARILYTYTNLMCVHIVNEWRSYTEMVRWLFQTDTMHRRCTCMCSIYFTNRMNHLPLSCDWYLKFSYGNIAWLHAHNQTHHSLFEYTTVSVCVCVYKRIKESVFLSEWLNVCMRPMYWSNNEINVEE